MRQTGNQSLRMGLDKPTSIDTIRCMSRRKKTTLSDQVRQAIDDSGLTRYRIAQETGIDESALSKIYNGQRGFNSDTLDILGEYLGLRIVMDRKLKKGK